MRLRTGIVGTLLFFAVFAAAASAYTTHIEAPAVLFGEDAGILTSVSLNVTSGNGLVQVLGPQIVNSSTLQSAQTAAQYASQYVGVNESRYDFTYTIYNAINVSGPSGGLALTLLAVSALQQRQLPGHFTATGTISPDGQVGEIGGVYDKAGAAAMSGERYILVPAAPNGSIENEIYYITQQQFDIPLIEVSNVSQALGYVYGQTGVAVPVNFSVAANYYAGSLPGANITCIACNNTAFGELANFTFSTTDSEINALGPQYASLKSQMEGLETQYRQIAMKGYNYSASDLSFLLYGTAYTIVNSNNVTPESANLVISNVSSYCASLTAPPMTSTNYEYVVGGELRQSWGSMYSGIAQQQVNDSQTSDDLIVAIDDAGRASGWCRAAGEMYTTAAAMGGQYVSLSPSVKANATRALDAISAYGTSGIYYLSALNNYKEGNYAASLYASSYATALSGGAANSGSAAQMLFSNLSTFNYGVWPTEFALQARFYLDEENLTGNQSYGDSAFYVAELAKLLSSDNQQVTSAFNYNVTAPSTGSSASGASEQEVTALSNQVAQLQEQVHTVYDIMLVLLVLVLVMLLVLLSTLLRPHKTNGRRRNGK